MKISNVYAYLRVSGASQRDGDGFKRQLTTIEQYCQQNGLYICRVYQDTFTGTDEHRPALAEMMVSLEQNGHSIKTVIVERVDRLARDLLVQELIVHDFRKREFRLISVHDGEVTTTDPSREAMIQMMGVFAQYDKTMTVQKLRAARDRKRATGAKVEGRRGYHETNEGRATLRAIHALRRKPKTGKRRTWQQVADELNRRGISTMTGQPWTQHRVYQIAHTKPNR